jgi:hypothetical protein
MSTTTAWLPAVEAGTGGTVAAAVVAAVAATAATASYCNPVATAVPCGGSPVAAELPAACDALDECSFVGTDASSLSALVGARAGTVGATLRMKKHKVELQPLETGAPGEGTAYLKVEKPRFLFLKGSGGAAVAPIVTTVALAGASAARAASSTSRPAAGASALAMGACSSAASAAPGDGGEGFHLSGGSPLLLSSSSSFRDNEFSGVTGGESLLLMQPVLLILVLL